MSFCVIKNSSGKFVSVEKNNQPSQLLKKIQSIPNLTTEQSILYYTYLDSLKDILRDSNDEPVLVFKNNSPTNEFDLINGGKIYYPTFKEAIEADINQKGVEHGVIKLSSIDQITTDKTFTEITEEDNKPQVINGYYFLPETSQFKVTDKFQRNLPDNTPTGFINRLIELNPAFAERQIIEQAPQNPALRDVESTAKALEGVKEFKAESERYFEYVPIEEIEKYKEFDRTTEKKWGSVDNTLEELIDNIRKNGIKNPITLQVDRNGNALVVEGNTRLAAAKKLGIKNIPVRVVSGEFGGINKNKTKKIGRKRDVGEMKVFYPNVNILNQENSSASFGFSAITYTKNISEAYHKAKKDDSNPELVQAVESLLSKEQTPQNKTQGIKIKEDLINLLEKERNKIFDSGNVYANEYAIFSAMDEATKENFFEKYTAINKSGEDIFNQAKFFIGNADITKEVKDIFYLDFIFKGRQRVKGEYGILSEEGLKKLIRAKLSQEKSKIKKYISLGLSETDLEFNKSKIAEYDKEFFDKYKKRTSAPKEVREYYNLLNKGAEYFRYDYKDYKRLEYFANEEIDILLPIDENEIVFKNILANAKVSDKGKLVFTTEDFNDIVDLKDIKTKVINNEYIDYKQEFDNKQFNTFSKELQDLFKEYKNLKEKERGFDQQESNPDIRFSIIGEQGAANLDLIEKASIRDRLERKTPIVTKRELFNGSKLQEAKSAFENYADIVLPMSANYQELSEIFDTIDNGEVLYKIPYNLIEEDYGVNKKDIEELINRYRSAYNRLSKLDSNLKEATFRMDNLLVAKEMEQAGKTPKEIRLATGWERGADSLWRYETDDTKATLKFNIDSKSKLGKKYNLESVLDYPELFNAFPLLKKVKISISEEGGSTTEGFFDGKQIVLGVDTYRLNEALEISRVFSMLEGLSKESQNIIKRDVERERYSDILREQGVDFDKRYELLDEKFPRELSAMEEQALFNDGLAEFKEESNEMIRSFLLRMGEDTKRLQTNDKYHKITRQLVDEYRFNKLANNNLTDINSILKPVLLHEIQHWIQKKEGFARGGNTMLALMNLSKEDEKTYYDLKKKSISLRKEIEERGEKWYDQSEEVRKIITAPNDFLYIKYKSIAGEAEASNVENRMNMTPQQRRETLLQETEDVAREDQIFLRDNLGSQQLSAQQNNSQLNFTEKETLQQTLTQLQLAGLIGNFYFLTPNEIENRLVELGYNRDIAYSIAQSTQNPYYDIIEGFYSPIEKAVTELPQEKGTANQFLAQIKKSKGVKQEELLYTGVEQYLTEQGNNKITKQDILDYMKENRIEIREVVKGAGSGEKMTQWRIIDNNGNAMGAAYDTKAEAEADVLDLFPNRNFSVEERDTAGVIGDMQRPLLSPAKFETYQLEGEKENYKEILITLPNYEYIDSHWSEKGILVWVRMNTRIDDNGNKVLFLEEIQSGAGQKGKKEGFVGDKQKEFFNQFKYEALEVNGKILHTYSSADGETVVSSSENKENARKNAEEVARKNAEFIYTREVPTAPFVTSTPSWIRLAMKTAIKEAVRQGATSIAWTTGEQQSDRYSLAEQVNSILVTPNDTGRFVFIDMKSNYDVTLNVDKNGKIVEDKNNLQGQQSFVGKDLEDIVGKDMAQKILLETKENKYQGEGLKVGGQGMRAFYDNIVPKETKKLIKELTGKDGVVGETMIEQGDKVEYDKVDRGTWSVRTKNGTRYFESEKEASDFSKSFGVNTSTQQSIEITPELKKAVSEGLPMFSQTHKNGKVTTNGFTDFNDIYINTVAQNPLQTALHEYGHIYLNKLKQQRPDLYNKGIELSKSEEAQDIINFVKKNQPKLQEGSQKFNEEVLAEVIGRSSEMLIMDKKSDLTNWLSEVWDWIKQQLGLLDMTTEQVANLTLQEYASAIGVDMLKGERLFGQEAQEYFTRNADRLPLTLQVFQRPEFVKMQGKEVNPITVLNSLNQSGIKQIEKDLIKRIIEESYQGQKKISYDELEATVRANIMPLERIFTSSYANYGMDNLGNGNYGEANTIILNAPIEHGVTGHFSGDFKASNRTNIKYVPKQLNDNTWVAVEEGYETGANENNIYQFVGTAGTKEAVDVWIDNYEKPLKDRYQMDDVIFEIERNNYNGNESLEDLWNSVVVIRDINGKYLFRQENAFDKTEEQLKKEALGSLNIEERAKVRDINKGMFGHIRVWQDGEVMYGAEMQSDYFQKQYVVEDLTQQVINFKEHSFTQEQKDTYNSIFRDMRNYRENYFEQRDYLKKRYGKDFLKEASEEEIEALNTYKKTYEDKKQQYEKEVVTKARPLFNKQEKQFIASQKEWEKRMVREAIKEAALSGATELRFPTPYTLSVIEGYLSEGTPYVIENANDSTYLEAGDRIYYAGEDYTLIDSDNTTITIAESGRVQSAEEQDIIDNEIENFVDNDMYEIENNLKDFYTEEDWNDFRDNYSSISSTKLNDVANEVEEGFFEVSEGKIRDIVTEYYQEIFIDANSILSDSGASDIYQSGTTFYYTDGTANIETLMQPSEYKGQGTKDSFSIEDDLDDTQQTVANKYLEIAEILKQERGEDNFQVVTDDNGFDWYSTKIAQDEVNRPVIAFQQLQETDNSIPFNSLSEDALLERMIEDGQIERLCRL